ncbi:g7161 [Coccomyxa elongata]
MPSRAQQHFHRQGSGLRNELTDYDESLLLDRSIVHTPAEGFGNGGDEESGTGHIAEPGRIFSTVCAVFCYWACACAYTVFLFIPIYDTTLDDFHIKASAHILLLFLALLLESYLRMQHRKRQQAGFLAFYWSTRGLLSIPSRVTAVGQGVVTMVAFWPDVPAQLNQLRKLQIITCIELAAISAFAVAYGYQVWRHNHEAQPDAQLYLQTSLYSAPTTSHRGAGAVVEQQAEAMRWLSKRCHNLQREVLRLSIARDREEEGVSAGVDVCRTDLEHRLAARERELRALAAEKDVLSQQARAAWSLLDERTAAAHELEVLKQQQMDENARLRATLEEWSHRNARLEARLNRTQGRLGDALAQAAELRSSKGPSDTSSHS